MRLSYEDVMTSIVLKRNDKGCLIREGNGDTGWYEVYVNAGSRQGLDRPNVTVYVNGNVVDSYEL